MLSSEREGLKQGGNFRGSFYLTEIKQVHSIVDNLVYNLFIFRMIGHSAQEAGIPVESATTLDSRLYVWAFSTMH